MDCRIKSSSDGRHTTPFRRIKAFKLITRAFLRADKGHVLGCFLAFAQINAALLIEILLVVPAFGSHETSFPWWFMAWKAMENAPALKYYDGESLKPLGATWHIFRPVTSPQHIHASWTQDTAADTNVIIYHLYMPSQNIFFVQLRSTHLFRYRSLSWHLL